MKLYVLKNRLPLFILSSLFLYLLFFLNKYYIQHEIVNSLPHSNEIKINYSLAIDSPLPWKLSFKNISVYERSTSKNNVLLFTIKEVLVDYDFLSIFQSSLQIGKVEIVGFEIFPIKNKNEALNIHSFLVNQIRNAQTPSSILRQRKMRIKEVKFDDITVQADYEGLLIEDKIHRKELLLSSGQMEFRQVLTFLNTAISKLRLESHQQYLIKNIANLDKGKVKGISRRYILNRPLDQERLQF